MWRRTYARGPWWPQFLFPPWVVRLLTRVLGKAVADVRDTCLAHWSPGVAPGLEGFLLHPVPFHPGWAGTRGDAAKLFSPPEGRLAGLSRLMFAPWRRRYFRQPQGPFRAPDWRNPELLNRRNSTGIEPLSQGDSGLGFRIYLAIYQRITKRPEGKCRKSLERHPGSGKPAYFKGKKRASRSKCSSFLCPA